MNVFVSTPATHLSSIEAALIVETYWPGLRWVDNKKKLPERIFQRAMNEMQIALIKLHEPRMDAETRARAKPTIADLEGRLAVEAP
jgi:hypothetical protein